MSGIYDPLRSQARAQGDIITPTRLASAFDGAATHAASDLTGQLASLRTLEADPIDTAVFPPASPLLQTPSSGISQKVMQVPTSGLLALEYLRRTSDNHRPEHLIAVDHLMNAQSIFDTDPHHFQAYMGKIQTPEALFAEWGTKEEYKKTIDKYCSEFNESSDNNLIQSIESFFSYMVTIKKCSVQMAIKAMIYHYTFSMRLQQEAEQTALSNRGTQLLMWLLMYELVTDNVYEETFRGQCIGRNISFAALDTHIPYAKAEEYPGIQRLKVIHTELTPMIWSYIKLRGFNCQNQTFVPTLSRN